MGGGASVQKRDLLFPYPYSISSIQNYIIPRRVRGPTMGTSAPGCPNNPGECRHVDKYNETCYVGILGDFAATLCYFVTCHFNPHTTASDAGHGLQANPPLMPKPSARPRVCSFKSDFFAVLSSGRVRVVLGRQISPEELPKMFERARRFAMQCRAVMQIRAILNDGIGPKAEIFAPRGDPCLFWVACAVMEPEFLSFCSKSKPVARSSQSRAQPTFDAPESILLSHSLFHVHMLGVGLERGVFGLVGLMMGLSSLSHHSLLSFYSARSLMNIANESMVTSRAADLFYHSLILIPTMGVGWVWPSLEGISLPFPLPLILFDLPYSIIMAAYDGKAFGVHLGCIASSHELTPCAYAHMHTHTSGHEAIQLVSGIKKR